MALYDFYIPLVQVLSVTRLFTVFKYDNSSVLHIFKPAAEYM